MNTVMQENQIKKLDAHYEWFDTFIHYASFSHKFHFVFNIKCLNNVQWSLKAKDVNVCRSGEGLATFLIYKRGALQNKVREPPTQPINISSTFA